MTPVPVQITFKGMAHHDDLEVVVRERAEWLARYYRRLIGCRVVIEVPHRHTSRNRQFRIHVELRVPGGTRLAVTERGAVPEVAVHNAFDAARRRLEDFAREQRGAVKLHIPALQEETP